MVSDMIKVSVDNKVRKADLADRSRKTESKANESFIANEQAKQDLESVESLKRSMTYKNQPDSE